MYKIWWFFFEYTITYCIILYEMKKQKIQFDKLSIISGKQVNIRYLIAFNLGNVNFLSQNCLFLFTF